MNLALATKACLVAGASRGIGRAIAEALAREGARVAAIARGREGLDALPFDVKIAADVSTAEGAQAAIDGTSRRSVRSTSSSRTSASRSRATRPT